MKTTKTVDMILSNAIELTGSTKQITWAQKLRAQFVAANAATYIDQEADKHCALVHTIALEWVVRAKEDARWWIDHRDQINGQPSCWQLFMGLEAQEFCPALEATDPELYAKLQDFSVTDLGDGKDTTDYDTIDEAVADNLEDDGTVDVRVCKHCGRIYDVFQDGYCPELLGVERVHVTHDFCPHCLRVVNAAIVSGHWSHMQDVCKSLDAHQ